MSLFILFDKYWLALRISYLTIYTLKFQVKTQDLKIYIPQYFKYVKTTLKQKRPCLCQQGFLPWVRLRVIFFKLSYFFSDTKTVNIYYCLCN